MTSPAPSATPAPTTPALTATPTADPGTGSDVSRTFATGGWSFTENVAGVFDEHVTASVPYYDLIQTLVATCTDWLLPTGSIVADIGASTGTTIDTILRRHPDRKIRAHLYDDQQAMLDKAKAKLAGHSGITYRRATLPRQQLDHHAADLTLALFTLQFMPLHDRRNLLRAARKRASPTGAILIAEKIRVADPRWSEIARDHTTDWKTSHGIPDEAIVAKQRSLRGVLVPYPVDTLETTLADAGWCCPEVLWRYHEWALIGAFATPDGLSHDPEQPAVHVGTAA